MPGDPSDVFALVFIAAKRTVSAVDGRTGDVLWSTEVPGSRWVPATYMTLAADPGGVYATRNGRVTCLDPLSGEILWSIKPPGGGVTLPVVATMLGAAGPGQQAQVAAHAAHAAAAAASASAG